MQITFNNKQLFIDNNLTLQALLEQEHIDLYGIAVTVNSDIVPRAKIKDFIVQEGMVIDVFTLVAGG